MALRQLLRPVASAYTVFSGSVAPAVQELQHGSLFHALGRAHAANTCSNVTQRNSSSASSSAPTPSQGEQPKSKLDFEDAAAIFQSRSFSDLLRVYAVLKVCSVSPLVSNADLLVRTSRRLLGDTITFGLLRATFFKVFCAGESEADIWPTIRLLEKSGIGAIIDYAAEDDVQQDSKPKPAAAAAAAAAGPSSTAATTDGAGSSSSTSGSSSSPQPPREVLAVGRTYAYADEEACDRHVEIFLRAIDTVGRLPGQGFAAIKVTALGSTQLLQRMSAALLEIRSLFREADTDGDGFVDAGEFERLYLHLFPASTRDDAAARFAGLDLEGAGRVDIISWSHRIHLADMPAMVERIRQSGTKTRLSDQLCSVALTEEEVKLAQALLDRVSRLAAAAAERNVKLMIDAEHTYFQPAIDHTTQVLSLRYNRGSPVIFNTYQAYLRGSFSRLQEDIERARREQYVFAAKLVRGAYVKLERARAARLGYASPIWDNIQQTHENFDACLDLLLNEVAAHGAELMVASHNQPSIQRAVDGMAARGIPPRGSGVYFGQLLGMSDNLTFTLGQHGYAAFKYVPYGSIQLVMPYLIRRAHENSAIMGAGVATQAAMLRRELVRRLTQPLAALMQREHKS